jgi:hypothetical protein
LYRYHRRLSSDRHDQQIALFEHLEPAFPGVLADDSLARACGEPAENTSLDKELANGSGRRGGTSSTI